MQKADFERLLNKLKGDNPCQVGKTLTKLLKLKMKKGD